MIDLPSFLLGVGAVLLAREFAWLWRHDRDALIAQDCKWCTQCGSREVADRNTLCPACEVTS